MRGTSRIDNFILAKIKISINLLKISKKILKLSLCTGEVRLNLKIKRRFLGIGKWIRDDPRKFLMLLGEVTPKDRWVSNGLSLYKTTND